jgi:hypothetical protein
MKAIEAAMREQFDQKLSAHLARKYGRACDSEMRALVRRGTAKAEKYGIASDRGIACMLEWIIEDGEDFDTDPQRPLVRELLNDSDLPEPAKLQTLIDCRPWRSPESQEMVESLN